MLFNLFKKQKKLSLFLSGGAARGIAHVGVLKAFETFDFPIHKIYATSAGAIVAALYCSGYRSEALLKIVKDIALKDFVQFKLSLQALFSSKAIETFVLDKIGPLTFNELKIPLSVIATDLISAETVLLNHPTLNVAKAVRASASIPGIFTPTEIDKQLFVDGAIANHIPYLKKTDSDVIIACNTISKKPLNKIPDSMYDIIDRSIDCALLGNLKFSEKNVDLLIDVVENPTSSINLNNREKLVNYGFEAIKKNKEKIEMLLK